MNRLSFICLLLCVIFICSSVGLFPVKAQPKANAKEHLLRALEDMSEEIVLQEYQLSIEDLQLLYREMVETSPSLFHVAPEFSYTYDGSGQIIEVLPSYRMNRQAMQVARAELLSYFEEIATKAKEYLTEGDQIFFIFRHLLTTYGYSLPGEENYDIASLLIQGHGVCQAFSLMFMALCNAIGIEADMVASDAMDHAWNHVKVDGYAYHVDITRSIPSKQIPTPTTRFLLSDAAMDELGYHDYECHGKHICTKDIYEKKDELLPSPMEYVVDALYVNDGWLLLDHNGYLFRFNPGRANECMSIHMDIDGDGFLSLSDILSNTLQVSRELQNTVGFALRRRLLRQILDENS
ncbi:MAG: transglutaminase domain-containing protein [Ruminococcaceae bacterium]|nr:transglutaminase domain-containing protein [Oscillospiraceae bacterium]